jgi:hypothetical protein
MNFHQRSTATKTKMLTVCKKCGKQNGNGYQYCTTCHKAHKKTMVRKGSAPHLPGVNSIGSQSLTLAPLPTLDIAEIVQACEKVLSPKSSAECSKRETTND